MAVTNHGRVGKALELLKNGLGFGFGVGPSQYIEIKQIVLKKAWEISLKPNFWMQKNAL